MMTLALIDDRWEATCDRCGREFGITAAEFYRRDGWAEWWHSILTKHERECQPGRTPVLPGDHEFVTDLSRAIDLRDLYLEHFNPNKSIDGRVFLDGILYALGWRRDPAKPGENSWLGKTRA